MKKPPYAWKKWENDLSKGKELNFYGHSSCIVGDRIVLFGGIFIFIFNEFYRCIISRWKPFFRR